MRARSLLAVLSLVVFASACTILFPLDGIVPADADDAGAGATSDAVGDAPRTGYVAAVLDDAPVLYFRLGEKSGPTAHDETSQQSARYGEEVTYGAPGAILRDPDTAVTFAGKPASSVTLPSGFDFPGKAPFSVEVWARQTARTDYGFAVDHHVYQPRSSWSLRFSMGNIAFERWNNDEPSGVYHPSPLTPNVYQHVVGTFDGTTAVLYIDGEVAHTAASGVSMPPMKTSWSLGVQNCACGVSNFIGSLDELAIYDKALSAERVRAHYKASGR